MTEDGPSLLKRARSSGTEALPQPLDLGPRVRGPRKARGWTLELAAKSAGMARATLSKIENGQMSPTYDALKKLATGLGIRVPQLFTPARAPAAAGPMAVTMGGAAQSHATATHEHESLPASLTRKRMLPYRATIDVPMITSDFHAC